MITVQLKGGLGNMMMQIAAAYTAAMQNNDDLILSEHGWDAVTGSHPSTYRNTIFAKANWTKECLDYPVYKEKSEYELILYKGNIKLDGYFQNPRYFDDLKYLIYYMFFGYDFTMSAGKYIDLTKLNNSVSVHVRRGDYLRLTHKHPPVTRTFILQALRLIFEAHKIDNILVFSDDMKWCKETISDDRVTFVDTGRDDMNIFLMSLCDHNIISNSTYSWWGQYFNDNEDKIVIAPYPWYGDGTKCNLYTDNMIKL